MSRKNKRWIRAAIPLTVAAMLGLGACAAQPSGGVSTDGDAPRTAALSMPYLTNQFMVSLNDKTVSGLKDAGWKVLATTDAGSQPDKQVQDVKNLIAAGASALAIDPFDSGAIVAALGAAEEAGVPVVLVDVGAAAGTSYMTVRADNVGAAATVCEEMGARLSERYGEAKGTILQLQGELSSIAAQDRTKGFEDCMAEKFPDVEIVSQPTNWDGAKAANAAQTVVSSRHIDGIYLQSDCGMLSPVQAVLKQSGKSTAVDDPDRIIIGGIDGCPTTLKSIRAGQIDFTVEQPLNAYGQRVAYFLDAALAGKTFSEGPDEFGGQIVKTESGALENLVPATLITRDNVDDDTLWGNAG
ncbi:sugar ABC transporter substrate-binding protein [Microbacterium sp.]|uniref:sugar ABC transporter substrate-binding protein n=1 Tax=Microbacterium sp. TaxID=51671 RepID=UPI003A8E5E04